MPCRIYDSEVIVLLLQDVLPPEVRSTHNDLCDAAWDSCSNGWILLEQLRDFVECAGSYRYHITPETPHTWHTPHTAHSRIHSHTWTHNLCTVNVNCMQVACFLAMLCKRWCGFLCTSLCLWFWGAWRDMEFKLKSLICPAGGCHYSHRWILSDRCSLRLWQCFGMAR